MTDLSGTPAEQVAALGLAVGDTIEGSRDGTLWSKHTAKLIGYLDGQPVWDWRQMTFRLPGQWLKMDHIRQLPASVTNWRKISSDPSIDPAEPLRRELMAAYALLKTCYDPYHDSWQECVDEWLARNAAPGAGEGEG